MNMFTVIANAVVVLTIIVIALSILAVLLRYLSDSRQARIHRTRIMMKAAVDRHLSKGTPVKDLLHELAKDQDAALGVLIDVASRLSRPSRLRLKPVFAHFEFEKNALTALHSRQWSVRVRSAMQLGFMNHQEAIPELIKTLDDEMLDVRLAAAHALAQLGATQATRPILRALALPGDWPVQRCTEILAEMGPEVCDALLAFLAEKEAGDEDPSILVALRVLGMLQEHRATANFFKFLKSPDREFRLTATKALGHSANPRFVDELCTVLKDEAWEVRSAAAQALGKCGNEKAMTALSRALGDSAWWVRFNAANSLYALGQQGIKVLSSSCTSHSDEFARDISRQILEEHGAVSIREGQPS